MQFSDSALSATANHLAAQAEVGIRVNKGVTTAHKGAATPSSWFRIKGALDRVLAALLLIPALPVIAVLVVLVRLTSPGPGIYRQVRVGRHGREYLMYKIRTMRHDAEARTGAVWTSHNDPRITILGRFLRTLHLDEFPQLFNVLRGEMSLIGPRPERPEFVKVLSDAIPVYADRLLVLPGITGLAQINLPPDTDLDSVRRKLILDLQYVNHASLWMDTRMFLCTMLRLIGVKGEWAIDAMRLRRHVKLSTTVDNETAIDAASSTLTESKDGSQAVRQTVSAALGDTQPATAVNRVTAARSLEVEQDSEDEAPQVTFNGNGHSDAIMAPSNGNGHARHPIPSKSRPR